MLSWIQVDANLKNHRKAIDLAARVCDRRAHTYLVDLWAWASQNEPTGLIRGAAARLVVEHAAGWAGEPDKLTQGFIDSGWIDVREDGLYLHDWHDHQGAHIAHAEKEAERMRVRRANVGSTYGVRTPDVQGKKKKNSKKKKETTTRPDLASGTPVVGEPPEVQVFEHWKRVMNKPRAAFDEKRKKAVKARFQDGYVKEELFLAIDGCARTPHNMGENDRHQRFDDLELICRNAGQVDRFIENAKTLPPLPGSGPPSPGCADCGSTDVADFTGDGRFHCYSHGPKAQKATVAA